MIQAQQAATWTPPLNFEEKLKKYLLPPQLYMYIRYRKERRRVPEIRMMPFLCHPEKLSLDVGANKGIYSYAMLGHSSAVHAFEPHPKMFDMMTGYLGDRITAHRTALSDKTGTAEMHLLKSSTGYSNLGGTLESRAEEHGYVAIEVEAKRLDDCGLDNIGFIKIDVEGFEMQVIAGATEVLKTQRPNLLVEVESAHNARPLQERIDEICSTHGYRCFALRRGQLTPFAQLDPAIHFISRDGKKGPDYIFNFIFLPE